MNTRISALCALGLMPMAASAGEFVSPDGTSILTFTGVVTIESLHLNGNDRTFRYGNLDANYRFVFDSHLKVGFDLGSEAVVSAGKKGSVLYGAVVVEGDYGKVSVGLPRLVLPQVFDVPALGGSEVVQLVADLASGQIVREANLLKYAPTLRGARYDVTYGPVTVNAALHEFAGSNAPIRQLAATYDGGAWKASLGYGEIDGGKTSLREYKAAVRGRMGKLAGGIVATRAHVGGGALSNIEAYATYDVTSNVTIGAQVIDLVAGGDANTAWGVSGTYTTPSHIFLQGGVTGVEGQNDHLLALAIGFNY